jgi:hypothetical protein
MITKEEMFKLIIKNYPEFENIFNTFIKEFWGNEKVSGCTIMNQFDDFTMPIITGSNHDAKTELFSLIEKLVVEGDEETSTAACTCYIENLINQASHDDNVFNLRYEHFVPYLGPESREYVRAWDKFTGVKTPGIDD